MILNTFKRNIWIISFGFIFAIFSSNYNFYFESNQNTYLLHAFLLRNPDALTADWYSNTVDGTPVFSYVTSFLFELGNLFVINFNKFFEILFFIFLAKIILKEHPRAEQLQLSLIVLLLAFLSNLYPEFLWGVKRQFILGHIYQPSIFGVLYLPALYFYLKGKNFLALLLIFTATLFHPSLFFTSASIGLIFLINLKNQRKRILFFILGATSLLPTIFYTYMNIYDPKFSEIAAEILVNYRIPHHADLMSFGERDIARILVLVIASFLSRDLLLKKIFIFAAGLMLIYLLLFILIDSNSLYLLFPLRISILLVPVALALIFVEFFIKVKNYIFKSRSNKNILFFSILITLIFAFMNVKIIFNKKINPYLNWVPFANPEMVWLTPINDPSGGFVQGIRLNLLQPIFVDKKSHPINNKEIAEWKRRIDLTNMFYLAKNKNEQISALEKINRISEIKYILIDKSQSLFIGSEIVFSYDNLELHQIN